MITSILPHMALSWMIVLLNNFSIEIVGLERVKQLYAKDVDFATTWKEWKQSWSMERTSYLYYHIQEGFLFKNH